MTKKLLLVDDEKFFLEGLKDGLSECEDVFFTDICFSVDQAIELYEQKEYDLVVSDIRMPRRSGLDLFLYLRENKFKGGFMAMTAYGSEEIVEKIRKLGSLDIILKPFDFKWFKGKVLDYFSDSGQGVSGTIDSIDLTSLLQMINLEKKSLTVKIEINKETGYLYFDKGELIHAEFRDLLGDDAAFSLLKMNKGRFSLLKIKKNIPVTIELPFLTFMINAMKDIDEENKDLHLNLTKEDNMDVKKLNDAVAYLKNQLGDGLVSSDIYSSDDGQSIAGYNSSPKANALFNKVTMDMTEALANAEEDFAELGRYYMIDLVADHMVIVLYLGDYQWGILFNKKKVQLGLLLNVVIPKIIDLFEEAITE